MGSDRGLMSYDGTRFKIFPFINNLAISVNGIKEGPDKTLWCKNFSNQVFFLNSKGYLQNYQPVTDYFSKNNEILTDFFPIGDHEFWLVTNSRVVHYVNGTFKEVHKEDLETELITHADFNRLKKELSLFLIDKVVQINEKYEITVYSSRKGQKLGVSLNDDVFYFISRNDTGLYDIKGSAFNTDVVPQNIFFNNLSYIDGQLWVCTSMGIYEVDFNRRKLKTGFLKEHKVTDIVQDLEGNRWVSTLNDGLYMIPDPNVKRAVFENGESRNFLLSLAKSDDNRVFVGDIRGKIYEFSDDGVFRFLYDTKTTQEVENIFIDDRKILTSIGIFTRGNSTRLRTETMGKCVTKDYLGNYVVAGSNFAAFLTYANGNPLHLIPESFPKVHVNEVGFIHKQIIRQQRSRATHYSFYHQKYYIGYSDGLFLYNQAGDVGEITTEKGQKIIATDIKEDAKGNIWVSTSQNGLFKIYENKVVRHFIVKDGLLSTFCRKIDVDESGVWIATNEGVNFYSFFEKKIYNVSAMMAFQGIAINDILSVNNKIWLATSSGLIFFDKAKVQKKGIPNFRILRIRANDKVLSELSTPLTVDYYNSRVKVSIEVNHFKSLGNFFIEYQLLPIDSTWHRQLAQQRDITFLSLNPNNYKLKVRLRSGDQISEISQVSFLVAKPFWMTYWFITLCIFCFGFVIYFVYRFALQQSSKKQLIKEQLAMSQLTALRSQMNPHFMFNVLNAVQGLIYSNQKTKANEYLGSFSDLMRKTLGVSDKKEISIAEELETIQLYVELEKARFDNKDFEAFYHLPEQLDLSLYLIPTLIIQPFVENAIKHGLLHKSGSKILQMTVEQRTDDYWVIVIEDNGIGRQESAKINQQIRKHQPFATRATSHRIQLINKISVKPIKIQTEDLMNSFQKPCGTRVTIWIPVKRVS